MQYKLHVSQRTVQMTQAQSLSIILIWHLPSRHSLKPLLGKPLNDIAECYGHSEEAVVTRIAEKFSLNKEF